MPDRPDFTTRSQVDIIAQTIDKIKTDIAAQTVDKLNVNIASQTLENMNVNIAAQTLPALKADIVSQTVDKLNVDITAQTIPSLKADIVAQSVGNLGIDLRAQTLSDVKILAPSAKAVNVGYTRDTITLTTQVVQPGYFGSWISFYGRGKLKRATVLVEPVFATNRFAVNEQHLQVVLEPGTPLEKKIIDTTLEGWENNDCWMLYYELYGKGPGRYVFNYKAPRLISFIGIEHDSTQWSGYLDPRVMSLVYVLDLETDFEYGIRLRPINVSSYQLRFLFIIQWGEYP